MLYIIEHAGDSVLFVDTTFVPIIEQLAPKLPKNLVVVVMADTAIMSNFSNHYLCYETLISKSSQNIIWPYNILRTL